MTDNEIERMTAIAEKVTDNRLRLLGFVMRNGELQKAQADIRFLRLLRMYFVRTIAVVSGSILLVYFNRVLDVVRHALTTS